MAVDTLADRWQRMTTTEPTSRPPCSWLPWSWCNLRRNPFGELSRDERAELAVVNVTALTQLIEPDRHAVQLIGDCGRGKTTHLLAIQKHNPDASYTYLAEDEPCAAIAVGRPILIDEAQRLPRRVREEVFSSGLPLVLGTHRDLSRPLRRAGYQVVTRQVSTLCDAEHVSRVMNRRIDASRLTNGAVPLFSMADAEHLVRRFGNNIRAMEAYLYEMVQQQRGPQQNGQRHGEMRFID